MKVPFNAASDFRFMTILFNSRLQVLADNQDGRDRVFVLSWIISLSHLVSAFVLGTSTDRAFRLDTNIVVTLRRGYEGLGCDD